MPTMTHPAAVSRAGRAPGAAALLAVLLVLTLAALGATSYTLYRLHEAQQAQTAALEALRAEVDEVDRAVDLMRIESSAEGRGIEALIDRLRHYAPEVSKALTLELPVVRERIEETMQAIELLGPDAYDELLAAFESAENDDVRAWLVHAMLRADPTKAKQVAARVVRGTQYNPSPRLRNLVADHLINRDHEFAGEVLEQLLLSTSARGAVRKRVPPELREEYLDIPLGATQTPTFHTFVAKYLKCDPPNAARTLTQVIGREEHDRVTIQTCIKALGQRHHRPAADRIKELYRRPPGPIDDPLFRNTCLRALGDILGDDACSFFQEELLQQPNEIVKGTLQDLIKQHCGGPSK